MSNPSGRRFVVVADVPPMCKRAPGETGPRSCIWTGCRYHRLQPPAAGPHNPPVNEPGDHTCALDVAASSGGASLGDIAEFLGNSPQAVEKVEKRALAKLAVGLDISLVQLRRLMTRR